MIGVSEAQVTEWQQAIGRELVEEEILDPLALRRFARAVGREDETDRVPLPHWAFFLPCPHDELIGADGHPRRGSFLPDVTLPRRMFAASAMTFIRNLKTGTPARQTNRVIGLKHKAGRSGDLVFAEVEKQIEQYDEICVSEVQTYVYRSEGEQISLPEPAATMPEGDLWDPREVNLFRFSAATFNGHRIHYDLPYTAEVEGYPALIVHGPFAAAKLAELAMRDGTISKYSFRAVAPLFVGQPIVLRKVQKGSYEAMRCDGMVAMTATAEFI
jgi:3-methylfumaryl-CoA hydratase